MKSLLKKALLMLLLLLITVGCGRKTQPEPSINTTSGITAQYNEFMLPPNFSINDNIVVATVPETVAKYSGGVIGTDQNKLETALRTLWQDNNYRLKSSEHSFAITNLSNEVWRILVNLARVTPGENTAVNAFGGAVNNNDFTYWGDLTGMPTLEEVLEQVEEVFLASGLGQFRAIEAYAMEASVLAKHEDLWVEQFNRVLQKNEKPMEAHSWNEEDSCYLIIYASLLDEIPIYTKSCNIGKDVVGQSFAYALIGADGLLELRGSNLYSAAEIIASEKPVGADAALERFLQDMQGLIHAEGTALRSMELCYLPVPEGKNRTTLRPVWAFEVSWPRSLEENSHADPIAYDKYLYDAISGEFIDGR